MASFWGTHLLSPGNTRFLNAFLGTQLLVAPHTHQAPTSFTLRAQCRPDSVSLCINSQRELADAAVRID